MVKGIVELKVRTITWNMARLDIDFNLDEVLKDAEKYDIIIFGA